MKWLIVDCNNILWKAYHGRKRSRELRKIQYSLQEEVLTTFIQMVVGYQRRFSTKEFVFCWDYPPYLRKELLATYKSANTFKWISGYPDDRLTVEKFGDVLKTDLLPNCGFKNVLMQAGYEADDVIASVCESIEECGDTGVIVSSDEDLLQLIRPWIELYGPHTQLITTHKTFKKKYLIDPIDWWKVKAIGGCPKDNVKGIEGIRETRALNFVQGKECPQPSIRARLVDQCEETLKRNRPLVKLPFKGVEVFPLKKDKVTRKKWFKVMDKYKIPRVKLHMPLEVITSE